MWFVHNILRLRDEVPPASPQESWEFDNWAVEGMEAAFDVYRKRQGLPTKVNHEGKTMISIRAMHGPGKTFWAAAVGHTFRFAFPATVICTAPKFKQVQTRMWPAFRKIAARAVPAYSELMRIDETQITWLGGVGVNGQPLWDRQHYCYIETATKPDNIAGIHDQFLLIIIDEPTGVPETLWPAIESAMSTGCCVLVMIGNPIRTTGTFANSHLKEALARDYYRIKVSLDDARRVSKAWVERMVRKYGPRSPVVLSRCYSEFPDSEADQLVTLAWIEAAREREMVPDGSLPRMKISIDVGDGGDAETIMTCATHFQSFIWLRRQRSVSVQASTATVEIANRAEDMFKVYGGRKDLDSFTVDALGVGTGVASELTSRGYAVLRYKGGSSATDPLRWRNQRAQAHLAMRDSFREGRVMVDEEFLDDEEDWDDFLGQMTAVKMDHTGDRVEDIERKEVLQERLGSPPDRLDSTMMQWAYASPDVDFNASATVFSVPAVTARYDGSIAI